MLSPITALLGVVLDAQLIAPLPRVPLPEPAAGVARAVAHENRVASGRPPAARCGSSARDLAPRDEWRGEGRRAATA